MENAQPLTASPLPLWWSRPFRGQPSQVSKARSWLAGLLPSCEPLDDLLIFTSELVTNAVTHTRSGEPGGWFTVEVTWSPQRTRVVVGDQGSNDIPASSPPDDADLETGRGLLLIEAMSAAWGTAGNADARWLWADVDWRSRGGPLPTAPSDNSARQQFAAMRCAYSGTRAWYSPETGQWHATLPSTSGTDDILTAPSPGSLVSMLTSQRPAARDVPPPRPHRLPATPLPLEAAAALVTPPLFPLPGQRTGDRS
jgi:hypothetical protein